MIADGRSAASGMRSVRLEQHGRICASADVVLGPDPLQHRRSPPMLSVPDPDDCSPLELPIELVPMATERFDYRLVSSPPLFGGTPFPSHMVWMRSKDIAPGPSALVAMVDTIFPTLFLAAERPLLTLTSDMSVFWTGRHADADAGNWMLAQFDLLDWNGSWACEDARIWSASGSLLAISRQQRRVLRKM